MQPASYLALGDSYTIGEGVLLIQSFPYQLVQELRRSGLPVHPPEVIARTGWTTGELLAAMDGYHFLPAYDFVTLLIGVNNQYRGLALLDYGKELDMLMHRALHLAGGRKERVAIVSIPDYGVTPFAGDRDRGQISAAIDEFNNLGREKARGMGFHYEDITPGSRRDCISEAGVAADGLHPSAAVYATWAAPLSRWVRSALAEKS